MMRRDYILEQIQQFAAFVARILKLSDEEDWEAAERETEAEYARLFGIGAARALQMSDTELLAQVIKTSPGYLVESRIFMLATLLKSSGDRLVEQDKAADGALFQLRGLDLLLDNEGVTAIDERPDFLPTVEAFRASLREFELPVGTLAKLMRHYERTGEFAKAEDALFAIADVEPPGKELRELGEHFYQRILSFTDIELRDGDLARAEAEAGLNDFRSKIGGDSHPPA